MNQLAPVVPPRGFAWSYSKLKNYETCARRYEQIDLLKIYSESKGGKKSPELQRGDDLHIAMHRRVQDNVPLPPEFSYMERWAEKFTRKMHPNQSIHCELKLAVDRQGHPVGYFDKNVWLRGLVDYVRILPIRDKSIAHIVDYKTGRPKDDYTQLLLNSWLIFCYYKDVMAVRTDFLWTEYNDTSHENFTRADMKQAILGITPRVNALETAQKTNEFPPNPCGLCKEYCPVVSCEFHGRGRR